MKTETVRVLLSNLTDLLMLASDGPGGGGMEDSRLVSLIKGRLSEIEAEVELLRPKKYCLMLTSVNPNNRIGAVKGVRFASKLGLKEALDIVRLVEGSGCGQTIAKFDSFSEAKTASQETVDAGSSVRIVEV